MADYYERGMGLGQAYLDGQGIAQERMQQEARRRILNAQAGMIEGTTDDANYARGRMRADDAAREEFYSRGAGVPTPAPAMPADYTGEFVTLPAEPTGVPAPGGPAKPGFNRAAALRFERDLAAKRGKDWTKFDAAAEDADFEEAFNEGSKKVDMGAWIAAGNNSQSPITIHKTKGGYEVVVVRPNGTTNKVNASEAQMRQLAGLQNAMKVNPAKALEGIAKIDADLAAMFGTQLTQQLEVTKGQNDATHKAAQDASQAKSADASMISARASASRAATDAANNKQLSPQTLAELNALSIAVDEAKTPVERAAAVARYNRRYATAATEIGKVMQPKDVPPKEDKVNPDGSVWKDGVLYVPDPKKPGAFVQAQGLGQSALDKAIAAALSGNSPAGGSPTAAAPAKKPSAAPTEPTVGLRVPAMRQDPAARILELTEALAADDRIKSGVGGLGARALQEGRVPMGMGARAAAEAELRRLQGAR